MVPKHYNISTMAMARRKQNSVKRLVNVVEYSTAMSALLSNGTADITEGVLV